MDGTILLDTIARDAPIKRPREEEDPWSWDEEDGWIFSPSIGEELLEEEEPPDDPRGTPLRIECRRCKRSLGRYYVSRVNETILLMPRDRPGNWRRGRLRIVDRPVPDEGRYDLHYEWICGCGAEGYRRGDRLAGVAVMPDVTLRGGWVVSL